MKRILITRPMPERVSEAARALFEVEMREENTPLKPGQMKGALALYDGIMPTLGDMFSAEIFAEAVNSSLMNCPWLRWPLTASSISAAGFMYSRRSSALSSNVAVVRLSRSRRCCASLMVIRRR